MILKKKLPRSTFGKFYRGVGAIALLLVFALNIIVPDVSLAGVSKELQTLQLRPLAYKDRADSGQASPVRRPQRTAAPSVELEQMEQRSLLSASGVPGTLPSPNPLGAAISVPIDQMPAAQPQLTNVAVAINSNYLSYTAGTNTIVLTQTKPGSVTLTVTNHLTGARQTHQLADIAPSMSGTYPTLNAAVNILSATDGTIVISENYWPVGNYARTYVIRPNGAFLKINSGTNLDPLGRTFGKTLIARGPDGKEVLVTVNEGNAYKADGQGGGNEFATTYSLQTGKLISSLEIGTGDDANRDALKDVTYNPATCTLSVVRWYNAQPSTYTYHIGSNGVLQGTAVVVPAGVVAIPGTVSPLRMIANLAIAANSLQVMTNSSI